MFRVMIIRHAEKHRDGSIDRGVSIDGIHTKHELTVRGWMRAAALVRLFAPPEGFAAGAPLSTPRTIFASAATELSPSLRALRTVESLAETLGIGIDVEHAEGEERIAAAAIVRAAGPVLVAWHHSHIVPLARSLAGRHFECPEEWPEDRFDVVWVLDRDDQGRWRFTQVPQRLFIGDRAEVI